MNKEEQLLEILENNKNIRLILERANKLKVPNWYLGAGGIAQTVWNALYDFDLETGIKDYDLVYYDARDISYEAENVIIQNGKKLFQDIPIPVEIINEARVHLWYEKRFGVKINPYQSVEDAIDSWPTTATAIGVNYINKRNEIYSPFGLEDLLNGIIRASKVQITKEIYDSKVNRWKNIWSELKVIPLGE